MSQRDEPVHRLNDPDFRHAEVALKRAAEKAQRQAREAGLEPVVRQSQPATKLEPNGTQR
ncbi:MAG: hypothetical protein H7838_02210 [Magnetococcus sp. DMHC-8]